jgi:hypothetical protein
VYNSYLFIVCCFKSVLLFQATEQLIPSVRRALNRHKVELAAPTAGAKAVNGAVTTTSVVPLPGPFSGRKGKDMTAEQVARLPK